MSYSDPLKRINPAATDMKLPPGLKPTFYECGICNSYHPATWDGDCRQDNARYAPDELDARFGYDGWNEIDMGEVDGWRTRIGWEGL